MCVRIYQGFRGSNARGGGVVKDADEQYSQSMCQAADYHAGRCMCGGFRELEEQPCAVVTQANWARTGPDLSA